MKAVKVVLFVLLALFVLLVIAVGALFLPGVQKFLVARLAVNAPDESLEMDYLHIGLGQTEARNVRYIQGEAVYRVADLSAELSLSDLLFSRELQLGDVVATGVRIDLTDAESAEESEPFEGLLRQLELPMPLYLDSLQAKGVVRYRGPEEGAALESGFTLAGGGFAPNQEGGVQFTGNLQTSTARFDQLGLEGSLRLRQGDGGRIERARLLAQLAMAGVQVESRETLQAEVVLLATAEGETYEANLGRLITAVDSEAQPDLSTLVTLDATFSREEGVLEGSWEVDIDREQLAAFLGEMELPVFAATGNGTFSYGGEAESLVLAGNLALSVESLGLIAAELRELGGFTLQSQFDLRMDQAVVRLEELAVALNDSQGRNLMEARSFQPLRYNRQAEQIEGLEEGVDLAELTIRGLPVEWANLFLAPVEGSEATAVQGGGLSGQLRIRTDDGGLVFNLVEPLRLDTLTVFSAGEPWLSEVSVEAGGAGTFRDGAWSVELENLQVHQAENMLVTGTATLDSATSQARASLQVDLPLLLRQPLFEEAGSLTSGSLEMDFEADLGAARALELNGSITNLASAAEGGPEALPSVTLQAELEEVETDVWQLDLPVQVEGETLSDLRVTGTLRPGQDVMRFEANVSGEQLAIDEVLALASVLGAGEGASPEAAQETDGAGEETTDMAADDEPTWSGWEGGVTLSIGEVLSGAGYQMRDLAGELSVGADEITSSMRATVVESPVTVEARVDFLAGEEQPYQLEGIVEAPELAAAELFRQLQPDRPPTLEGIFVVTLEIEGRGRTLGELAERVRGRARVQSGGGIIRLLYTENPLMGLGSAAGALLGTFVKEVDAVTRIAQRLSNLPYAQMNIEAERDEELNFILEDLTVLSPEIHLEGTGQVLHREELSVLEQPMTVNLRLGAEGELEEMLAEIQVLGDATDDLGYRYMRTDFMITGTPANPDSSVFYRILVDAVLEFVESEREEESPEEETEEEEPPFIPQLPDIFEGILRGD